MDRFTDLKMMNKPNDTLTDTEKLERLLKKFEGMESKMDNLEKTLQDIKNYLENNCRSSDIKIENIRNNAFITQTISDGSKLEKFISLPDLNINIHDIESAGDTHIGHKIIVNKYIKLINLDWFRNIFQKRLK
jgi:hypothetical protein